MKTYLIRAGFSFVNGSQVLGGGEYIQLPDDVAGMHLHKLEEVAVEEQSLTSGKEVATSEILLSAAQGEPDPVVQDLHADEHVVQSSDQGEHEAVAQDLLGDLHGE